MTLRAVSLRRRFSAIRPHRCRLHAKIGSGRFHSIAKLTPCETLREDRQSQRPSRRGGDQIGLTWIKTGGCFRWMMANSARSMHQTGLSYGGTYISNTLTQRLKKFSGSMIKQSIRRRIVAIAVGLIILMVATSVLSMVMVGRVGHLLDELTARYVPANAHLTRINILSLERALALRRMVIAKMQEPPDVIGYRAQKQLYDSKDVEVDSEAQAARKLINAIIDDASTPSDNAALGRIDSRIDSLMSDGRRHLKQTSGELISALDAQDFAAGRRIVAQVDFLRDELDGNIDAVRSEHVEGEHRAPSQRSGRSKIRRSLPRRLSPCYPRLLD